MALSKLLESPFPLARLDIVFMGKLYVIDYGLT